MEHSDETVKIKGEIEERDLFRENLWHHYSKWHNKFLHLLSFGLLLLFLWVLRTSSYQTLSQMRSMLIFMGIIILIPIYLPLGIWIQTKQRYADLKGFQRNISYAFTSNGYEINDEKSSSQISWESIHKVVETKRSFNLFINKNWFHLVPKRFILNAADLRRLRNILQKSLAEKAYLQK